MKTMIARLIEAVSSREALWARAIERTELARAAGVSPSAVTQWFEKPGTKLRSKCVFGLANFLKIDPLWLSEGKGSMERNILHDAPDVTESLRPAARELTKIIAEIDAVHGVPSDFFSHISGLLRLSYSLSSAQDSSEDKVRGRARQAIAALSDRNARREVSDGTSASSEGKGHKIK